MLSRGFQGDIPSLKQSRLVLSDLTFLAVIIVFLFAFRIFPITEGIGRVAQELAR